MSSPGAFDKERQALLITHSINPDYCVTSNAFLPTLRVEKLHTTPSGETFLYTEDIPISVDEYQHITGKHFQRNHGAIADPEPCDPPPPCDACRTERAPITPDERAVTIARLRNMADRAARFKRPGDASAMRSAARALEAAEADLDGFANAVSQWKRRALDAEAEVARLRAATSPAWDEDAATEAVAREVYRRLYPGHTLTHDHKRTPESDAREADAAYVTWDAGREGRVPGARCREIAARVLAVVREHLPARPSQETVEQALRDAGLVEVVAVHEGYGAEEVVHAHLRSVVDAVLAEWPRRAPRGL